MSNSSDPMDYIQPTRLLRPWDFPGKSTGVGQFHFRGHRFDPWSRNVGSTPHMPQHNQKKGGGVLKVGIEGPYLNIINPIYGKL